MFKCKLLKPHIEYLSAQCITQTTVVENIVKYINKKNISVGKECLFFIICVLPAVSMVDVQISLGQLMS